MIQKILITGGAGYVGTRLANHFVRNGYKVRVLDSLIYGANGLYPEIEVIQADINDIDAVHTHMQHQDAVFHLAAISNDPTGNLDPEVTHKVNYVGTTVILDAAQRSGVERFIFASSSSVMGIQDGDNITEMKKPNPITPYSEAKLKAEQDVIAASSSNFITTALRPATICGPSPRQRFDLVINALVGSAFFDRGITVYGGNQRRPNLTINDMLRAYDTVLNADKDLVNGEIFHVGWENLTIMDMAQRVSSIIRTKSGKPVPITIKPAEDMRDYHISSDKIENVLDFKPGWSIDEMVFQLVSLMRIGFIPNYIETKYHNLKVLQDESSMSR